MVSGITRTETESVFADQEFTLNNFISFAQEVSPAITQEQVGSVYDTLVSQNISTFMQAFTALDTDPDGIITAQEITVHCATCQAAEQRGLSADAVSADGVEADTLDEQMGDAGSGNLLSDEAKDTIINGYLENAGAGNVMEPLTEADVGYLKDVMIYSGAGNYDDASVEAFRLIVDMYTRDADFKDMLQYYIDQKGSPNITMAQLSGDSPGEIVYGIGNIDGNDSVVDITNIMSGNTEDTLRFQETVAHELMHNLGMSHGSSAEQASFDRELGTMFDMTDSTPEASHPWHGYSDGNTTSSPAATPTATTGGGAAQIPAPAPTPSPAPTPAVAPTPSASTPALMLSNQFNADAVNLDFSWVYSAGSPLPLAPSGTVAADSETNFAEAVLPASALLPSFGFSTEGIMLSDTMPITPLPALLDEE